MPRSAEDEASGAWAFDGVWAGDDAARSPPQMRKTQLRNSPAVENRVIEEREARNRGSREVYRALPLEQSDRERTPGFENNILG